MFQIRVTEVCSGDHIYLQTSDATKVLVEIEKLIASSDLKAPSDFKPKEREVVLCQFSEDKTWYRAKITGIEKNIYSVFYVDFGNQEKVKFDALRPASAEIKKPSFQAKEGFLAFVHLHKEEFRGEARAYVQEFCHGKELLARHEYSLGSKIFVSIFDEHGKYGLNADLIRNGLAFVSQSHHLTQGEKKEVFAKPLSELVKQEDEAKKEKLNLWQYGDIHDEDEK